MTVSCSGVMANENDSGTGRSAELTNGRRPASPPGQVALEPADVAERRGHEHELRLRQLDQRHLPGPAAIGIGVEMELVHHDLADVGGGTVA